MIKNESYKCSIIVGRLVVVIGLFMDFSTLPSSPKHLNHNNVQDRELLLCFYLYFFGNGNLMFKPLETLSNLGEFTRHVGMYTRA